MMPCLGKDGKGKGKAFFRTLQVQSSNKIVTTFDGPVPLSSSFLPLSFLSSPPNSEVSYGIELDSSFRWQSFVAGSRLFLVASACVGFFPLLFRLYV